MTEQTPYERARGRLDRICAMEDNASAQSHAAAIAYSLDIPALLAAIDELTRDLNDAVDAHIKITAAMRCGGRTPEKALDTMLRIRQKLGRDK